MKVAVFFRCETCNGKENTVFLYKIIMAIFTLYTGTAKGKSWKATGIHPKTGRNHTIQGGQKGVDVSGKSKEEIAAFIARHETAGITPKIYINALRWNREINFGDEFEVPDELF